MEAARAFFREAGCGPAVVCMHSSASSSAQWRPLMDRLAGRFHTLAVDLYGSGKTPAWPGHRPLTLADEAALHGVLIKVRDLTLPLLAVNRVAGDAAEPGTSAKENRHTTRGVNGPPSDEGPMPKVLMSHTQIL